MKLAFLFPGQGSQSVGMLVTLADAQPQIKDTYAEASEALGYDLWRVVSEGPEADLNRTDVTQPAMLAAGVACWRVWNARGGARPEIMAGHSLGEYTALVCADSLGFADAVRLVAERGRLMQEAVPAGTGAIAAILGLEDERVREICVAAAEGEVVEPVNFNSPGQVVIAGHRTAVERAIAAAKQAGARRAVPLPMSVPSHCSLMRPAAERLAERLGRVSLSAPAIPVIHNCDVASHADVDEIRDVLARQLYCPVRWVETIEAIAAQDVDTVVECGPGKVLAGLNKRIDRAMNALALFDPDSLDAALQQTAG